MSYPAYSRAELVADGAVHVIGVSFGVIAAAILIVTASLMGNATPIVTSSIYAAGLIAMLTCSAIYNLARPANPRSWLRRADHAAIFVMIAGTCTPFALIGLTGWGIAMTATLWTLALAGVTLKLFFPRRYDRLAIALYLGLGWGGALVLAGPIADLSPAAAWLLTAGGVLYSAGVVFHVWEKLRFHNAVWHVFVLLAAICHYSAVMTGVVLAGN